MTFTVPGVDPRREACLTQRDRQEFSWTCPLCRHENRVHTDKGVVPVECDHCPFTGTGYQIGR